MTVTNQNLIVPSGGGHQRHYPIWKSDSGLEYISLDGQTFTELLGTKYQSCKRETVVRK